MIISLSRYECNDDIVNVKYGYTISFTLCVIIDAAHECCEENESKESILIPTVTTNLK